MEEEISRILTAIKEKSCSVCTNHMKHYVCNLKNVYVDELELSEKEPDTEMGSDGKQVRVPFSSIFDPQFTKVKPDAAHKTVLIQGEAAVGKTMLCLSVVEEWASGKMFQEFQLILLLSLNSRSVASASSLSGLLNVLYADFKPGTSSKVASYLKSNGQHNILLIADGWEELQASQCQAGSFLYSLLFSSDIIPTSSTTVLITSRPGCIETSIMQTAIDRLITLTGFERKAIKSIVQSEFADDFKSIRYLTAQLNDNPLIVSACETPLNLAVVCNLCQASDAEPLPDTMMKLYSKLIWILISASIDGNYPHESCLSSHRDLPEELHQLWWEVCELAFSNVEKGCTTFSFTDLMSSNLKKISHFGLIKPTAEARSFSFIHPCFEEFLAALHLAKLPQEAQIKFMHEFVANEECKSKTAITFWHFFVSYYAHEVASLNPDVVDQVLKILLAAYCTTKQKYYMDLCHLSYEAKYDVVSQKVIEAISIVGTGVLRFGQSHDVYDFNSMVYVLQNVTQESEVEINFQDSNLRPEHVNHLANALCEKSSIIQIKGLNLSGNTFSNSLAVDFFNKGAAALKSLKVLILRNCDIGTSLDIKAMLSALAQSTSPTLTYFDLSFNSISISFLQVLQHHLESYDTFESLQNLGLKGSLHNDVTTCFLANFSESDALSSKCKRLRRLDLSENYLGEPGNPDLSKVVTQLLSLGRDFNLCLNDEYMSEVRDQFVCVMEESIKKKGTINHTIAHGVIVGPGRSGKNTLMSRLMGNGPPKSDTVSPSTGVLENIVKVEVKKLSTVAAAVSNLEWKKLQYDEEALELIMTTARHHSATTTISKPIVPKYIIKEQTNDLILTTAKTPIPSKRPKHTKHKIVNFFEKFKRFKIRKSHQYPVDKLHEEERGAIVYAPDVEPVDIFKQAVKLRGMDALREHLESSWSLYLTNIGGQIEFQEHLPLLVCRPSIFFVIFPLHHDLDKPYDVCYEYPDGRVETYKSPGTLLQELLQTLATISASLFISGRQKGSEARIKPKVFFVSTHKDCLPENGAEEIIQRKDELLQSCVRQTALFDQGSIQFAEHPKRLIFAVNNLSNDDDEFQKIWSAVQTTVERDEFTIECPSSWLILSLILRAKHKSDRVLSFDKCFSIARECGISDRKELIQALSFIHSRLGLVRYFDVKDLNSLVVIDPQVLFDKITDLIVKTFIIENVDAKKIEHFHQRGIIPVAVMQNLSDKSSSDSQLPFVWLTDLLNYLRIAAFFTDKDGDKYFSHQHFVMHLILSPLCFLTHIYGLHCWLDSRVASALAESLGP